MHLLDQIRLCEKLRHGVSPISQQTRVFADEVSSEILLEQLRGQCALFQEYASPSLRHLFPQLMGFLNVALAAVHLPANHAEETLMSAFPHTQRMILLPGGLVRVPNFPLNLQDLHLGLYTLAALAEAMLILKRQFPEMYGDIAAFRNSMAVAVQQLRTTAANLRDKDAILGIFIQFFLAGNPDSPFVGPKLFSWELQENAGVLNVGQDCRARVLQLEERLNQGDLAVKMAVKSTDLQMNVEHTVVARDFSWNLLLTKVSETAVKVRMISSAGRTSEPVDHVHQFENTEIKLIIIQQEFCVFVFSSEGKFVCRLSVVEGYDSGILSSSAIIGFGGRINLPQEYANSLPVRLLDDNYIKTTVPSQDAARAIPVFLQILTTNNIWGVRYGATMTLGSL